MLVGFMSVAVKADGFINPQQLRCEYLQNPVGVDNLRPRFSWTLSATSRSQMQLAYQILVGEDKNFLQHLERCAWDSGKVVSDRSGNVEYEGRALQSGRTYFWSVRVWDGKGVANTWSDAACFIMGPINRMDWKNAQWIGRWEEAAYLKEKSDRREAEDKQFGSQVVQFYLNTTLWNLYSFGPKQSPAPMLRKDFVISPEKKVASAIVSVCGLGCFELHVNGTTLNIGVNNPARSDYEKTLYYLSYDISKQIKKGDNTIGTLLGRGWYNVITRGTAAENEAGWTGQPKLLFHLEIRYADGSVDTVVSDHSWKTADSPILWDDPHTGEIYDARTEQENWDHSGFDDSAWQAAKSVTEPKGKLTAQMMPPVRITKAIKPVSMKETSPGVYVYDLGQNFAGRVRLKAKGLAGTKVTLSMAETPTRGDEFVSREKIRRHQFICILKGQGEETFEPRFSYVGFQYVQLKGFPGTPTLNSIEGCLVNTDLEQIGSFSCSDPLLNQLQQNVLWTVRSLVQGWPSSDSTRERSGWGDFATLAGPSVYGNFDCALFFEKWMRDCKDQFEKHDAVNVIIPHAAKKVGPGSLAWAGAWSVCAWNNYLYFGDKQVLADNYESWKKWVETIKKRQTNGSDNIIVGGLGDWVVPYPYGEYSPAGPEGPAIVTTSYFYHIINVIARSAVILGYASDAQKYGQWAQAIKEDFSKAFYNAKNGTYETAEKVGFRQSSQVVPMSFGLVSDPYYKGLGELLQNDIYARCGGHLDTGTIGTSHLLRMLPRLDLTEAAYSVVTQTNFPGWLDHIVNYKSTTIWENWWEGGAHNISCFVSVGAYLHEGLAGIRVDPAAPGYKNIIIRPGLPQKLNSVTASRISPFGEISSSWKREKGQIHLHVKIPPNTTADISVPKDGTGQVVITEGGTKVWDGTLFKPVSGLEKAAEEIDYVTFKAGSGSYRFEVTPVDAALALGRTLAVEWASDPSSILGEPGGKVAFVLTLTNRSAQELVDAQLELQPPSDCRLDFRGMLGTLAPGASCRVECMLSTPVSANGCRSVLVVGLIRTTSKGHAATIPLAVRLNLLKRVVIQGGVDREIKAGFAEPVSLVTAENCSGTQQALTVCCKLPVGWKSLKSLPYVPTVSSILDNNNRAERLCDHIVNHSTKNRWHSKLAAPLPHVITMKLERPERVNRLVLHASHPAFFCKRIRLEYLDPKGEWKTIREMDIKTGRRVEVFTIPVGNLLAQEFRLTILEMESPSNPIAQLNEIEILAEDSDGEARIERTMMDREVGKLGLNLDPGQDIGKPRTIEIQVDKDGQHYWQGQIQLTGKQQ